MAGLKKKILLKMSIKLIDQGFYLNLNFFP
jgi:hypothetical protein